LTSSYRLLIKFGSSNCETALKPFVIAAIA